MEQITRDTLKDLRAEINAALAVIGAKHGLTLKTGNATFGPDNFTMKVEGIREGGLDKDATRYANSIRLLGLPPLGTEFKNGGQIYKTVGVNTTGTKVICSNNGKKFLFHTDSVIRLCKSVTA